MILVLAAATAAVVSAAALAAGNPKAGRVVFTTSGCGGCHVFAPAGSKGTVGPALTRARLAADAKRAKQPYEAFVRTSIVKPDAFVAKGYAKGIMPRAKLTKKQLDDLVAFIVKG
jgi:mono/diheme cytochrome c family protein